MGNDLTHCFNSDPPKSSEVVKLIEHQLKTGKMTEDDVRKSVGGELHNFVNSPRIRSHFNSEARDVFKFGEKGSGIRSPHAKPVQDFYEIRDACLRNGTLFEDDAFPAASASVFYSTSRRQFQWMRPTEITDSPKFISDGASRFDVMQGELGDCWLLAAVANLTLNNKLFSRVVPPDQFFKSQDYAGIFHFRFWQYGKWIDIVIDDRLPTIDGKLVFLHSKDHNEFWSAMLEKAYAKLHGSYEALKGGTTCEAMEDFTGGMTEAFELQSNECPPNLFQIIQKAAARSSLMGCSIDADPAQLEAELPNGLIRGHAYSITGVRCVELKTARVQGKIPLIRIRNPWGNEAEWTGAWSDKSREWAVISPEEKEEVQLNFEADGEFWMSFNDFKANWTRLEICNLSPEPLEDGESELNRQWEALQFEGAWVAGVSAGGCRNNINTFATNPQYLISLSDIDEDDDDDLCTLIVALMQKNRRAKRKMGLDSLTIGFAIYGIKDGVSQTEVGSVGFRKQLLSTEFFKHTASVARAATFINLRELSARFRLPPGNYCIIPSTFDPNEEGEFMLRIFTEKPPSSAAENDDEVGIVDEEKPKNGEPVDQGKAAEAHTSPEAFFQRIAGDDMEVDALELQEILNHALKKEFKFDGFSLDSCRSMVAMLDKDRSGKLGFDEFTTMWRNVRNWCTIFRTHDTDNSQTINAGELKAALTKVGLSINRNILHGLVLRYSVISRGKKGEGQIERCLSFDSFIVCCIKLKMCIDVWQDHQKMRTSAAPSVGFRYGKYDQASPSLASFSVDEWVERVMYC